MENNTLEGIHKRLDETAVNQQFGTQGNKNHLIRRAKRKNKRMQRNKDCLKEFKKSSITISTS